VGYGAAVVLLSVFSAWSVRTYVEHLQLLADVRDNIFISK
jgi:hypothetical protein